MRRVLVGAFPFICVLGSLLSYQPRPEVQVIGLERTRCFGLCPVYTLRVDSSGTVSYNGSEYVAALGARAAKIQAAQFQELLQEFSKVGFLQLRNEYSSFKSDLPTTYIRLTQNGATKTIKDYDKAPPELEELERCIERTVNVHRWIHDGARQFTLNSPDRGFADLQTEDLKNESAVRSDSHTRIKPGTSSLMQAAGWIGDPLKIRKALRSGDPIDAADESGWTALMMASVGIHPDAVNLLIASGAHVDRRDRHGNTALIGASAVRFNLPRQPEILQILLSKGARVDGFNDLGETALMWAAKAGNPEGISVLLKFGAHPQRTDNSGHDALYYLLKARSAVSFDKDIVNRYDRAAVVLKKAIE